MRSRLKRKAHELEEACVRALKMPACETARRDLLQALEWDDGLSSMRLPPAIRGKVNQARAYSAQLVGCLARAADQFLVYDGIERLRGALADLVKLLEGAR
jgi:hypothetical protein